MGQTDGGLAAGMRAVRLWALAVIVLRVGARLAGVFLAFLLLLGVVCWFDPMLRDRIMLLFGITEFRVESLPALGWRGLACALPALGFALAGGALAARLVGRWRREGARGALCWSRLGMVHLCWYASLLTGAYLVDAVLVPGVPGEWKAHAGMAALAKESWLAWMVGFLMAV